ncbi:MAG: aminoacyl-tRNA hydrolase [Pseudomonadota bacterium]|jgi:PTH1 family peptidyl-tRNA hydrolase|nr:aminoacyl-tRNA hydrolase [Pseudomonas sp.]MEC8442873.1 aminoacyl-tRNA hydrolase [Pseudomonadota bacterium]
MADPIRLIVGLGNPGAEYEHTRHNAGFWLVEQLARQEGISLSPDKKFFGRSGKGRIGGQECYLLLPTTFMNRSGQAVAALANFYKIKPSEILVAHDELDMPAGVAKFKTGGGHGGQNGLRDIIARMSNQKDFHRLRIGIGHPGDKNLVTGHVLGRPSKAEQQSIDAVIDEALRVLPDAIAGDLPKAMNRLHSFKG